MNRKLVANLKRAKYLKCEYLVKSSEKENNHLELTFKKALYF